VVIGVSNRVIAQVLYGLNVGDRIVVGSKQASVAAAPHTGNGSGRGGYGAPSVGGMP